MNIRTLAVIALLSVALMGAGFAFFRQSGRTESTKGCDSCDARHQNLSRLKIPQQPD
jgi:hypothetical protein